MIDQLSVRDGMETAWRRIWPMNYHCQLAVGGAAIGNQHRKKLIYSPRWYHRLADYVSGAPALTTALAGVGVIEDPAQAEILQAKLHPGQAITSKDGSLWRWDGFVRLASKADKSAERIRQRQRLDQLQSELNASSKKLKKTKPTHSKRKTPLPNVKPSYAIAGRPALRLKRNMGKCGAKLNQTR